MTEAVFLLGVLWIGLTLYTVFAGADFGAGIWHLATRRRGRRLDPALERELLEHTIGPVWEANHVWLIFVITLFWTIFPPAFGPFAATLYIPLTIVALGVIARGAAYAFRKATERGWQFKAYGLAFGISSVLTPFVLGTIAGGLASGRVPPVIGSGAIISSWINPTSLFCGLLAVGCCAYLAAVYLTRDAERAGETDLAEAFRRRSVGTGIAVGVVALAGLAVLRADAPGLLHGITHRGLPIVILSLLCGVASIVLVARRRYLPARATAAATVATLLWGWGAAQYPVLLYPDLTVDRAAASPVVLHAVLGVVAASSVLLIPSLIWLFFMFQRAEEPASR
ncbi:cytochrome d ubiquinol oxidase subunit II [Planosporangium mesophilum]|uniref:Cytochrome D ubiquinol oxidase subunit II n=1 Tax=Planosporangium mesophilum TaxID=689768 RepID=A0A8J3T844_9ACTN|nr:cytochrome d ubiquinol oxidase subunit II [Planosporangium mesophilum]NJC85617.1 cytochrome d ubiquinol oxidase subunit II [Planosporangium mesophilum]GII21488.1 cytochrome D ubiquinol oxidase subunit II [Planosporangium mesophilum]